MLFLLDFLDQGAYFRCFSSLRSRFVVILLFLGESSAVLDDPRHSFAGRQANDS